MNWLRRILPKPVKDLLRPVYYFAGDAVRFVVRVFFGGLAAVMGRKRFLSLLHFLAGEIDTTLEVGGVKFNAAQPIPFSRAVRFLTKEPETIAWIDDFMSEGEVFYDVGANIGVFSLYAATRKAATVIAFEPLAVNYGVLNENINLNGLSGRITALNLALHDKTMLSHLNVQELKSGKAGNTFEKPIGSRSLPFEPAFIQGMIGMRMDDFIETYGAPFPNHVKIDVDANEPQIIAGMERVLVDPRLKSIAIELNTEWPEHAALVERISAYGFRMIEDGRYRKHTYGAKGVIFNHFFVRG